MEKRSWPWKKKTSDKSIISTDPQADEKVRHLNERLLAADDLARQHATVAEEAVSGWEKAKAEFMSLKYELDTALEQKQAAEVRVFHLDGALKECMQQLRQGREEQEQMIHEAIVKRSREWDKVRLDLEERLADAEGQLIGFENQKALLYKTDKERAEAVAELGRIHSESEAEIKKLQMQVQALDKENTSLKYEIVVLNKELGIRNQEREMNNRSIDRANQQQIESTKRIAKLETECQRLRSLVRKKLPGPGALLQMKFEAGTEAERGDVWNKRRSNGRTSASPKPAYGESRSPRMAVMGPGLHSTESFFNKERPHFSRSEDGNDDDDQSVAESWTSAIMSEPGYIQKETPTLQQSNNSRLVVPLEKLNSIDDFLEIERLAALPSEKKGLKSTPKLEQSLSSISEHSLAKEADRNATNKICTELSEKLSIGEEQLKWLLSENTANEQNLFILQQRLLTVLDNSERGDPETVLEKLKNTVNGLQSQAINHSGDRPCDQRADNLRPPNCSDFQKGSQIEPWICKVICIVEEIASKSIVDYRDCQPGDSMNGHADMQSKPKLQLSELEASVKNFNAIGNAYLFGKAELVQFMAELYSVLNQLNTSLKAYKSLNSRTKCRPEAAQIAEQEVLSDVGSPFSLSSNSDRSDSLVRKDPFPDERLANRKLQVEKTTSESHLREELSRMAASERVIVELKRDKSELEKRLEEERGKLDAMKGELLASEQLVATLRARLASAELSGIVAEKSHSSLSAAKAQLELQLKDTQVELAQLRKKLKDLEVCDGCQKMKKEQLQMKTEESRTLKRITPSSLPEDMEKSNKDQEIADATEKLAECQRTILVLGQQLKDIVSIQDGNVTYLNPTHKLEHAKLGNLIPTLQEDERSCPSHMEACSISEASTEQLITSPKSIGYESETIDPLNGKKSSYEDDGHTKPREDGNKQLVLYTPKTVPRKKSSLHSFAAAAMSKSLNLDASPIPRKHANSFSKLFSRNKVPSRV